MKDFSDIQNTNAVYYMHHRHSREHFQFSSSLTLFNLTGQTVNIIDLSLLQLIFIAIV
jgi:hypothetical protein